MGLVQYNIYVWWTHCRWIFRLRYDRTDYVTSKIQNDRTRSIHYHNIMYTEYWSFGLIKYLAIAEKLRFASEKKGGREYETPERTAVRVRFKVARFLTTPRRSRWWTLFGVFRITAKTSVTRNSQYSVSYYVHHVFARRTFELLCM